MNLSRDLGILLVLMGIGFVVGYFAAEGSRSVDEERAAIIGAVSSVGGMIVGYIYLAIEKRSQAGKTLPKQRQTYSPQVVGEQCTKCSHRVIFVGEAFFCADCGRPFHRRCGKLPRCEECDARVTYANRLLMPDWEPVSQSVSWTPTTSDPF